MKLFSVLVRIQSNASDYTVVVARISKPFVGDLWRIFSKRLNSDRVIPY
jgi:hypothetical protein